MQLEIATLELARALVELVTAVVLLVTPALGLALRRRVKNKRHRK